MSPVDVADYWVLDDVVFVRKFARIDRYKPVCTIRFRRRESQAVVRRIGRAGEITST